MTTIYGSSDDLIELEGDVSQEFGAYERCEDGEGFVLALSDGTLLSVRYDGCWRFKTLAAGSLQFTREDAIEESRDGSRADGKPWYSDVLTFPDGLTWAALADRDKCATKQKLRSRK